MNVQLNERLSKTSFSNGIPYRLTSVLCDSLSTRDVFNGLTLVVIVRTIFEALLEEDHTFPGFTSSEFYEALIVFSHVYISWMCLFAVFALLLAVFLEKGLSQSFALVLLLSPLCITVPFIDYFVSGGSKIDYGTNFSDFFYNYVNVFNPFARITMVSTGVRWEVFLAAMCAFGISWFYFKRGLLRAFGLALSIYTTIFLFGYLPAFMPETPGLLPSQRLFGMYLPVLVILLAFITIRLTWEKREWGKAILHLLYPSRLVFYLLLLIQGMVFTAQRTGQYPVIFSTGGGMRLLMAILSIGLLFVYCKLQNDFYDYEIDSVSNPQFPLASGTMSPEHCATLGHIFILPSFAFALASGRYSIFLWLLVFALSGLYSEPPLRLRRFYPFGHYVLSMIGATVFMLGASLANSAEFFRVNDVPKLTGCVFTGFFFLSHIKDFKDIEGDRRGGAMNVYNLTKCPRVIGIVAVCAFVAILVVVLRILSVTSPLVLITVGLYLLIAVSAILRTGDLRRLDWILHLSLILVMYISMVWLSELLK